MFTSILSKPVFINEKIKYIFVYRKGYSVKADTFSLINIKINYSRPQKKIECFDGQYLATNEQRPLSMERIKIISQRHYFIATKMQTFTNESFLPITRLLSHKLVLSQ